MKLITLKCPNCGADIEIENGIDTFYCKYCGYKIILDGQSDAAINAKVRIKEVESNERVTRERFYIEREEKKEQNKNAFRVVFLTLALCFLVYGIIFIFERQGKKEEEAQEKKFQALVEEIMVDIDNGDFDEARIKANLLYWDSSSSSSKKKKWDQTRKEILKQIDKAEKAAEEAKKKNKKLTDKFG